MQPDEFNPYRRFMGSFIPHAVMESQEISPGAKLCLARLFTYAGENGVAWPTVGALSRALGVSERMVQKYIKELREQGFLRVYDNRAKHMASTYAFLRHPSLDPDRSPMRVIEEGQSTYDRDQRNSQTAVQSEGPNGANELKFVRGLRTEVQEAPELKFVGAHELSFGSSINNSERKIHRELRRPSPAARSAARAIPAGGPRPKAFERSEIPDPEEAEEPSDLDSEDVEPNEKEEGVENEISEAGKARLEIALKEIEAAKARLAALSAEEAKKREKRKIATQNLKSDGLSNANPGVRAWVHQCENVWREESARAFPNATIPRWQPREFGQVRQLLDIYPGSVVVEALRYVVREWASINKRYFKEKGHAPSLALVVKLHDRLVRESEDWARHAPVLDEWRKWWEQNPDNPYPPSDLKARYRAAQEELAWMDPG